MADRFAGETSRAIFHKGREYDEELRTAEASFSFDLRVVPSDTSPEGVLLELRNFGNAPAHGNVELTLDGRRIDIQPFELEPGGRKLSFFPIAPPPYRNARGWLQAKLDTTDALPLDNTAFALLPVAQPPRVLLVTKGNWFLEKLLAADPHLRFELLEQLRHSARTDEVRHRERSHAGPQRR